MSEVNKIRSQLIDKILTINNKEFLEELDKLVSSSSSASNIVALTSEQKELLKMSEMDIEDGRLISQKAMNKRNLEWLNEM